MLEHVAKVRSFNRTVTQTIGALNDHYLGRDRPLAECRLIFEIGERGTQVGKLRARLDLDSGYLSRILRSLEQQRLVETAPSSRDKRAREVWLTQKGVSELAELDRRSNRLACSILEPLTERQQSQLTDAMARVEQLLTASAVRVDQVAVSGGEAQYCLGQYFQELGQRFEAGFDPERSLTPTLDGFEPPRGTFLVMSLHGQPVGCGGFMPDEGGAYVKRMWVSPSVRGLGLGRRMLQELEARARALGYRYMRLETEKSLTEAQQLYRRNGYREVARFNDELYAHHWFEKQL